MRTARARGTAGRMGVYSGLLVASSRPSPATCRRALPGDEGRPSGQANHLFTGEPPD